MPFSILRVERLTAARILQEEYGVKIPPKNKLGTDGDTYELKTGATLRIGIARWGDMQYVISSNQMDAGDLEPYAIM
jgi:hypothetical protein